MIYPNGEIRSSYRFDRQDRSMVCYFLEINSCAKYKFSATEGIEQSLDTKASEVLL